MAEGIMRKRWASEVGRDLTVSSMGIHGMEKQPPTDFAIQVCAENDIDISKLRSRPLVSEELKRADVILVMEPVQKEFLKLFYPYLDDMVFMLGSWPEQIFSKKVTVKDPVGGNIKDYRKAFKNLSKYIDHIIPVLRIKYGY
jgi:protein-tyrosine-phosphatase